MAWATKELNTAKGVILVACVVFGAAYVLYTFARKRSFVAMIVALLTAAVFIWGVNNIGFFRTQIKAETGQDNSADFGK